MKSKERMLRALALEKPDRLPVTVHQWQQYHLDTYLGGIDALAACRTCGLDASIQYFEAMGQFWIPNAEKYLISTPEWREEIEIVKDDPDDKLLNHVITTPGGRLTYKTGGNRTTTWITEYLIKNHDDVELINILTSGTPDAIRRETLRLFEGFGVDGGYICSASDHFFETPVDNLKTFAAAAAECRY